MLIGCLLMVLMLLGYLGLQGITEHLGADRGVPLSSAHAATLFISLCMMSLLCMAEVISICLCWQIDLLQE
jgi:hypothetical protein